MFFHRHSLALLKYSSISLLSLLSVCRSAVQRPQPPQPPPRPTQVAAADAPTRQPAEPTPAAAVPDPIRPLVVQPAAAFPPSLVRFTPDSAAKLAKLARDQVPATVMQGLSLNVWAPEGLISDPIALTFDERGRMYITRTARTDNDEIDIRGHDDWQVPSIGFRNVEDKRAFYQKVLAPELSAQNAWLGDWNKDGSRDVRDLTTHKESVYRLEDTNGDGLADVSLKILEDFNDVISDVAHGILSFKDYLYLTVSPDFWRLRDTTGDGVIDTKESLAHGSGIHIGFGGHGLSGPLVGPDGRLYWKQGDLGVNITMRDGRKLYNPMSGTIMRANLDGTDAEVFATGLRNPQEFAFDEYGNLIAPDNDGDHPGELERLTYVVDGMDSGWRINWQFGKYVDPDNNTYKVWMEENLFKPRFPGQAAYITPPIASWHAGPAGFAYNPGTALGDAWRNYFFNAVFTGSPAQASIQGFTLTPQGAGLRLVEDKQVEAGVLVTGMKFGPDGALYAADWVEGWSPKDRGRVWKIDVPGGANSPIRVETRMLIAADFTQKTPAELVALLHHADMRVRQKAQFELADRGALDELLSAAKQTRYQLERIHGLWGIGQLARKDGSRAATLLPFLKDGDPEIRAQAAKLIGDLRYAPAAPELVPMLTDPVPRPRFFAAEALGRIKYEPAIQPIIAMLLENDDDDTYLRHAGVTALARIGVAEPIVALAESPSRALRLAAVVALRRMKHPGVGRFMRDKDELVATEAARAINDDEGIGGAFPDLAAALDGPFANEALTRRAISANLRLGTREAAVRVAAFAARANANEEMRIDALGTIGVWPKPSVLDRVDGSYIGPVQRDSSIARAALSSIVDSLFANGSPAIQAALADAIGRLRLVTAANTLATKARSADSPTVRVAALHALVTLGTPGTEEALRAALQDRDVTVRTAALRVLPSLKLPEATTAELLASIVGHGSVSEQQGALASLGQLGAAGAAPLRGLVDQLVQGKVAPEIQLDVAEAGRATKDAGLVTRVDNLEKSRAKSRPSVAYADVLRGGNARQGQRVVTQGSAAQCVRCHSFRAGDTASVGPNLRGVATRLSRDQLLEALIDPSARISPGFGPVQLTLKDGQKLFATLTAETNTSITINTGSTTKRIMKTDIVKRTNGPSAMPPMGSVLTRREIRDVLEYLSTLR